MRQKELRIALVCYGGVSLTVYMHGVTKELWKLASASRNFHGGKPCIPGSQTVYRRLLERIEALHGLRLRVLIDIIAGASAGGINGVFLAQAIHSGQSLEPLTRLWLDNTDSDVMLDPDARLWTRFVKFWAVPVVHFFFTRPGNMVTVSVAKETRREVRAKLSRLVRSRWFEPPFGGLGFSRVLAGAFDSMAASPPGEPLLPPGHPLDLFVTATDFKGHTQTLRLHSPPQVTESEHRVSIGFRSTVPELGGIGLADPCELVFAARATASFPGAFPALQPSEIDRLAKERRSDWAGRDAFLARILPAHKASGDVDKVALIDGSVLVNAPFSEAISVLHDRPAQREVDRRFVYIDPKPDEVGGLGHDDPRAPGFFSVIFGSLSSIPREQPVRDNLEELERQSREMERLRSIVEALRPEVEEVVQQTFGHTFFLDQPTVKRLTAWRAKAQDAAVRRADYAYHGYAQAKFMAIIDDLANLIHRFAPSIDPEQIGRVITRDLHVQGLDHLTAMRGGASEQAISFFRSHDLQHRVRRLRLLARRLTQDWDGDPEVSADDREFARDAVYQALSLYFQAEGSERLGAEFTDLAGKVLSDPGAVLDHIAGARDLRGADLAADTILADAMSVMPRALRRKVLLAYLGFPFFDVVTFPFLHGEGLNEFDPVKIDRISPDDCNSIRAGGAAECLRGVEFFNFGAFFSRAYRENDYLWGRLHGAERMIDLLASALPDGQTIEAGELAKFKREAFLEILDEEEERLLADPALVPEIRAEVEAKG